MCIEKETHFTSCPSTHINIYEPHSLVCTSMIYKFLKTTHFLVTHLGCNLALSWPEAVYSHPIRCHFLGICICFTVVTWTQKRCPHPAKRGNVPYVPCVIFLKDEKSEFLNISRCQELDSTFWRLEIQAGRWVSRESSLPGLQMAAFRSVLTCPFPLQGERGRQGARSGVSPCS